MGTGSRGFNFVCSQWGQPTIDLFASRFNTKCTSFVSWKFDPEASFTDAFTVNWTEHFVYAFPPFILLNRVIQKMTAENVQGIVIAPDWTVQTAFALLKTVSKDRIQLGSCCLYNHHNGQELIVKLSAWLI